MLTFSTLRVRLHYMTKSSDVQIHDRLITFNNGLGYLKTKSGGGFLGGSWVGILF